MKAFYGLILGLMLGLVACQAPPTGLSLQDRTALEAASKLWVETYNRNDWAALSAQFTPNAVMMPPNSPTIIGRAAIAAWEARYESGFRIAFDVTEIAGRADFAYVRGRSCVFIPNGEGGYGVDVGKFLEIRTKQADGTWLIETDMFNSDAPAGSDLASACPFAQDG